MGGQARRLRAWLFVALLGSGGRPHLEPVDAGAVGGGVDGAVGGPGSSTTQTASMRLVSNTGSARRMKRPPSMTVVAAVDYS